MMKPPPLRARSTDPVQAPPEDSSRKIILVIRQLNVRANQSISADRVYSAFINQGGREPDWLEGLRMAQSRRWLLRAGRQITLLPAGNSVY